MTTFVLSPLGVNAIDILELFHGGDVHLVHKHFISCFVSCVAIKWFLFCPNWTSQSREKATKACRGKYAILEGVFPVLAREKSEGQIFCGHRMLAF